MTLTLSGEDRATPMTAATSATTTEAERLRLELAQLREKLVGQPAIEQAKGILMQTFGITAEHAFDLLRMLSQNSNMRLRLVARRVVDFSTRYGPRPDFDAAADFLLSLRDRLRASDGGSAC